MPRLKLQELVEATGGNLLRGDPGTVVETFVMDSRQATRGAVFFALKGAHVDGHAFISQVAASGGAAAVIERQPGADEKTPDALILVDDTVAALARCAAWIRRRWSHVRWIALSGSNGKTTTKEMIAEGLAARQRVHRTPGNFNNHLGVPLTLLALPDDAVTAVIELAMSGPGEIAALARMVDPDVGLLTNIRAVHMAYFRTLDDIAAAKGELFAVMRDEAIAVVNLDDALVRVQAARHAGPRVSFGRHPSADLRLEQVESRFLPGAALALRYQDKVLRLQLRIGGQHAAFNALAALAAIAAAGGDLEAAAQRLERLEAGHGRGRVHRLTNGIVLIDDSYNSSPAALAAVLDTLRISEATGRKVLVMGDMLELGAMEVALHREAGKRAAAAGIDMLIGVGPLSREAAEAARRAGVAEVHHYADSIRAAESIADTLRPGDLVVIKGSRRMRMELVVRALIPAVEEVH